MTMTQNFKEKFHRLLKLNLLKALDTNGFKISSDIAEQFTEVLNRSLDEALTKTMVSLESGVQKNQAKSSELFDHHSKL